MRLSVLLIAATMGATSAAAQSRYESLSLTCNQIHAVLSQKGHAIFRYPAKRTAGLMLFDRFVASGLECGAHEVAELMTLPAKDGRCRALHCIREPDPCDSILAPPQCR